MALGHVPIVSRLPAYEEVIENQVNGFIAESADDFINALNCLQDDDKRQRMQSLAFRKAREFDLRIVIDRWIEIIQPRIRSTETYKTIEKCKNKIYLHLARYDRRYLKLVSFENVNFLIKNLLLTKVYCLITLRKVTFFVKRARLALFRGILN